MTDNQTSRAPAPVFPDMASVPADFLADYLAHVAIGRMQSEIAAQRGLNKSTICRRIVKIENLRDLPAWDAVLSELQKAIFAPFDPLQLSGLTVEAAALHLAGGDPAALILDHGPALLSKGARIGTADGMERAVIMSGAGAQLDTMPRGLALAAVLLGWVQPGPMVGRVCMLQPVRGFLAALRLIGAHHKALSLVENDADGGGLIGKAESAQAHVFARAYAANGADLASLRRALPGKMFEALALVYGKGGTLGQLERALKLPARSGRVFLAAALSALAHRAQAVAA